MRLRKIVAVCAIAAALLMTLFPPWKQVNNARMDGIADISEHPAGYAFIATPPAPGTNNFAGPTVRPSKKLGVGMSIDVTRLVLQYAALMLAAVGVSLAVELMKSPTPARGADGARDLHPLHN